MHDTALRIGSLAMDIYANVPSASILEIGAGDVNGSLRGHASASTRYVGIDFEAGPGVDIVVEPGVPLPVDDDAFDLVIASSVLEHDPAFWVTFVEMCRKARMGGYIYLNVPSNGAIHRYPTDNWRFYPDSARALASWAQAQGVTVTLIESFLAEREDDIWNDFVAVFRKGSGPAALPARLLHERIASSNVWVGDNREPLRARAETEDMILIQDAKTVRQRFAQSEQHVTSLEDSLRERQDALARVAEEQARSVADLAAAYRSVAALTAETTRLAESEASMARKLAEESSWVFRLAEERQLAEKDAAGARAERAAAEHQLAAAIASAERLEHATTALKTAQRAAEARTAERFAEIATLTRLLGDEEDRVAHEAQKTDWLRQLNSEVLTRPRWWSVLPTTWRKRRVDRRLARRGLFDATAYLVRYPDVAADGMDPLQHYVLHGLAEGRDRCAPR